MAMFEKNSIPNMRKHFHVPDNYFLSHSVGCLPKNVKKKLWRGYLGAWQDKRGEVWPHWLSHLESFRINIANLLHVSPACICPQTNVSSALTKIIHSLPKRNGKTEILLSKMDFPTIGFVVHQARRAGFEVRFMEGDPTDPDDWARSMRPRTAIVHVTHALSNTCKLLPVQEICEAAKQKDIISIVDIAQSVGIVRIDVKQWLPDFVTGTSVKFLCGGPGACFMYAAPDMIRLCEPVDVGWFSHENPYEMDICNFRYARNAMRFFGGTPSPAPFICADAALRVHQKTGPPYQQVQRMLSILSTSVPERFLVSPKDPRLRGGGIVINPPERKTFEKKLNRRRILHDERSHGFRFSVHGYTSPKEINRLEQVLQSAF